ncbi:heterokaryon incompatibility protein-domain-containing protein [Hypomontagnella monticulosa]|nr:heterokaryon incompatibility protein-domain-containing protein [Hypomontagnella monticulosa]
MRLLKTTSYELLEANDIPTPFPPYTILSHTWISPKDEITYQDIKRRKDDIESSIFKQKGWSKLKQYCDRAAKDGWEWAWMDTCCIDKTNPADTQEAINAMFRWYQNAGICYAYLEDVDILKILRVHEDAELLRGVDILEEADIDEISRCGDVADFNNFLHTALRQFIVGAKWFTRGWTLQELLAPHYLVLVDRAWRRIGTRESWAMEIREASKIEARHLTGFRPTDFQSCSIAMRLSWAARRETTVEEDETYSLIGLFGISMPLIYGEGRWRAFNRFQRELIAVYSDDSVFAWKAERLYDEHLLNAQREDSDSRWGVLASSIKQFLNASTVEAFGHYGASFSMTNRGLEIGTKRWRCKDDPAVCLARLNCGVRPRGYVGIYLRHAYDTYDRIHIEELCDIEKINIDDWQEEPGNGRILIRANNYLDTVVSSSKFILKYPTEVTIGAKYYMDFSPSISDRPIQLLDEASHLTAAQAAMKDEIIVEANRLIFINIELHTERTKSELDVIVNLTENEFPTVGIIGRAEKPWERLGDPLSEALDMYNALATYLHFKVQTEPIYPMVAVDEAENVAIGVHLLPRPPRESSQSQGNSQLGTSREYILRITVDQNSLTDGDVSERAERHTNKRRRIS